MDKARLDADYHQVSRKAFKKCSHSGLRIQTFEILLNGFSFHECIGKVVKVCRECIEKTEPVLGDTHIYQLRIWSTLSEVQAYLQYFNDAAEYARKMVDGYM